MPKLMISKGTRAITDVLKTRGSFDLFISSSREPSKTISINPTVPNTGKIGFKSGMFIFNLVEISLTQNPKISNKITEGILVLEAVMSNI